MSKYVLLGKTVKFDDAADRFCQTQFFAWKAAAKAAAEFDAWYTQCGNIYTVLTNYWSAVKQIVVKSTIDPLYDTLAVDYQIYNISKETYRKQCLDLSESAEVYDLAVDGYNEIADQLAEEKEYREYRKATRAEAIGGGFGLGGAIKGMATAGAINMATGAAHSVANAIGNASSESDAADKKAQLYIDAREALRDAIERSVLATAYGHIDIVNENSEKKIISCFDSDQSSALLESAKKVEEKQEELLVEAFTLCPWYYVLHQYIFENFPNERRNIVAISRDFNVDLSDMIDELLAKEYTEEARTSEDLAQKAKVRIKDIMSELDVKESRVLNLLESDCLARLCPDIDNVDEEVCNNYLSAIKAYDALLQNKQPYIDKIQARIEFIWAKEDGDIFDNYILQLNILNPSEVEKGIKFIEERSRTSDSAKYITALKTYDLNNIKKIRLYRLCAQNTISGLLLRNLGWIILAFGVTMILVLEDSSFLLQTFPVFVGGVLQYILARLKKLWNIATLNNHIVHTVFTLDNDAFAQKVQEHETKKS